MKRSSAHRCWEITPDKVESAIQKIIEVGQPRKIILFGSYLRNKTHADSDVDFLVITGDDIGNPRKESVRIRRALRGISMPMDIIVVPESIWIQHKDKPGMIYREASREGRIVYES
jgi:predicted nucleotidyltransferase